jgi:glutamate synthase (ferredoxin)
MYTNSPLAKDLWKIGKPTKHFIKVMPRDYKIALQTISRRKEIEELIA